MKALFTNTCITETIPFKNIIDRNANTSGRIWFSASFKRGYLGIKGFKEFELLYRKISQFFLNYCLLHGGKLSLSKVEEDFDCRNVKILFLYFIKNLIILTRSETLLFF